MKCLNFVACRRGGGRRVLGALRAPPRSFEFRWTWGPPIDMKMGSRLPPRHPSRGARRSRDSQSVNAMNPNVRGGPRFSGLLPDPVKHFNPVTGAGMTHISTHPVLKSY